MIYETRKIDANRRIENLRKSLAKSLPSVGAESRHPDLAIYATGSLARHEASENSDLDAFFMLSGAESKSPNGKIREVEILHSVLESAKEQKFPDFSNDGEYLKFLHIDDVIKCIGSRDDDFKNAFTARMLLLLESSWLYGEGEYDQFKSKIVDVYFEDFHRHSSNFKPIFLLNDIIRFWRTLCLNYENARHWRESEDELRRAKGHLDNLKLKFSRLNICYSFISHLLSQEGALSRESVLITSNMTPIARLDSIALKGGEHARLVHRMKAKYEWFLQATEPAKEVTLEWIADDENRRKAFIHSEQFVDDVVDLTKLVAEENGYLRYFIV